MRDSLPEGRINIRDQTVINGSVVCYSLRKLPHDYHSDWMRFEDGGLVFHVSAVYP